MGMNHDMCRPKGQQDGRGPTDKGAGEEAKLPDLIPEMPRIADILIQPIPKLAELPLPQPFKGLDEGRRLLALLKEGGVEAWNRRRKKQPVEERLSPREEPLRPDDIMGVFVPGPSIADADLSGMDLRGADLSQVNFVNVNLRKADMRTATLCNACFWASDLRNADLSGADLRRARILDTDVSEANLTGSHCQAAVMWLGTKLKSANLQGARFRHALLDREAIQAALWDKADLDGAFFSLWKVFDWYEARRKP